MAILYPTSLANLVVEVGTRHCHQTLLPVTFFLIHLFLAVSFFYCYLFSSSLLPFFLLYFSCFFLSCYLFPVSFFPIFCYFFSCNFFSFIGRTWRQPNYPKQLTPKRGSQSSLCLDPNLTWWANGAISLLFRPGTLPAGGLISPLSSPAFDGAFDHLQLIRVT